MSVRLNPSSQGLGRVTRKPQLTPTQRRAMQHAYQGYLAHQNASANLGGVGKALTSVGNHYTKGTIGKTLGHYGLGGAVEDLVRGSNPVPLAKQVYAERHPIRKLQQERAAKGLNAYTMGDGVGTAALFPLDKLPTGKLMFHGTEADYKNFALGRSERAVLGAGHSVTGIPHRAMERGSGRKLGVDREGSGANLRPYLLRPGARLFDSQAPLAPGELGKITKELKKIHPTLADAFHSQRDEAIGRIVADLSGDELHLPDGHPGLTSRQSKIDAAIRVVDSGRATIRALRETLEQPYDRGVNKRLRKALPHQRVVERTTRGGKSSRFDQMVGGPPRWMAQQHASRIISKLGYEGVIERRHPVSVPGEANMQFVPEVVAFHPDVLRPYTSVSRPSARLRGVAASAPWLRVAHREAKKGTPVEIPTGETSLYITKKGLAVGPPSFHSPARNPDTRSPMPIVHSQGIATIPADRLQPLGAQEFLGRLARHLQLRSPSAEKLNKQLPSIAQMAERVMFEHELENMPEAKPNDSYNHPTEGWSIHVVPPTRDSPTLYAIQDAQGVQEIQKHTFDELRKQIIEDTRRGSDYNALKRAQLDQARARIRNPNPGPHKPPDKESLVRYMKGLQYNPFEGQPNMHGVRIPRGIGNPYFDRHGTPIEAYKQPPQVEQFFDEGVLSSYAEPFLNAPGIESRDAVAGVEDALQHLQDQLTNLWYQRRRAAVSRDRHVKPGDETVGADAKGYAVFGLKPRFGVTFPPGLEKYARKHQPKGKG